MSLLPTGPEDMGRRLKSPPDWAAPIVTLLSFKTTQPTNSRAALRLIALQSQLLTGSPHNGRLELPAVPKLTEIGGSIKAEEKDPRAGWVREGSKFLQTLYLLSVTCLRRGMRLVSLCTAGWLLKSGFLVVVFIRQKMTVTTMQAIKKTPMQ